MRNFLSILDELATGLAFIRNFPADEIPVELLEDASSKGAKFFTNFPFVKLEQDYYKFYKESDLNAFRKSIESDIEILETIGTDYTNLYIDTVEYIKALDKLGDAVWEVLTKKWKEEEA